MTPADEAARGPYTVERVGLTHTVCGPQIIHEFLTSSRARSYANALNAAHAAGRAEAEAERDEARRYGEELYRMAREVTCVWCGHQFESTLGEQREALHAHAKACEKHPIHAVEARCAKLAEALAECLARLDELNALSDRSAPELPRDKAAAESARAALAEYRNEAQP